jgi:hypothetical protein
MKLKSLEIQSSRFFGNWHRVASTTFGKILDSLSSDINDPIMQLPVAAREEALPTINPMLERLLAQLHTVTNNVCREAGIHELVSYFLRDLGIERDTHYLICVGPSLSTLFFIDWCKQIFVWPEENLFPKTHAYLEGYEKSESSFDLPIIFVPSVVIEDRRYWSAIGHELGHVIERRHSMVEDIHKAVEVDDCGTPEGRNYFHSREYVSDYIANAYFGPIYYEVAYVLLHVYEIRMDDFHPPYDARLYMMQNELKDINRGKRRVRDPSMKYTDIPQIQTIIGKARKVLSHPKHSASYNGKVLKKEMTRAVDSLKDELPYIGSPQALLNGYWDHRSEVIAALRAKKRKDPTDYANRLIADSIRLTNMKRTFDIMCEESELAGK